MLLPVDLEFLHSSLQLKDIERRDFLVVKIKEILMGGHCLTGMFVFSVCLPGSIVQVLPDLHLGRIEFMFNMQVPML